MSTQTDRRRGVNSGLAFKAPCRVATTANITLSGLQAIDGVTVVAEDRVLVKNQTTASDNGIYIASSSAWERAPDFDGTRDVACGTAVFVHSGSTLASSIFVLTTADPITIGTSSLSFSALSVLLSSAPPDAVYITGSSNSDLTAERVVTNTATVEWDLTVAGQAKANVPAATTSAAGSVELATSAETITGTDATRAVTPAGFLAAIAAVSVALPRGYIDGCGTANNSGDATNDIDFVAGVCRNSANDQNITCAAMTKRLDATWSAGTGNGMRSSSALANGTWHLFAISKADGTQDWLAHDAVDPSAVLPSGYTYFRRVASILRESAAIVAFVQYGDYFLRKTLGQTSSTNPGTSRVTLTLLVPTGLRLRADILAVFVQVSNPGIGYGLVTDLAATDDTPGAQSSHSGSFATQAGAVTSQSVPVQVHTNTSAQVGARITVSDANASINLQARGWTDERGKNA